MAAVAAVAVVADSTLGKKDTGNDCGGWDMLAQGKTGTCHEIIAPPPTPLNMNALRLRQVESWRTRC